MAGTLEVHTSLLAIDVAQMSYDPRLVGPGCVDTLAVDACRPTLRTRELSVQT